MVATPFLDPQCGVGQREERPAIPGLCGEGCRCQCERSRDIARTFKPFYGEAVSDRLHTLLTKHYEAVKAYSLASVAGNARQQDAAKAQLTSNTDEIAMFLSGINPHLPKDTFRALFATHVDQHVAQIAKFQARDHAGEEETWPAMEHHIYVIADTLAAALVKQFPAKFM
jgi:hypothetical protein